MVEEVDQESFFTSVKAEDAQSGQFEDVVLYTGNNKEKICSLGAETIGCVLLDCGSTANVCGKAWADSYVAALSVEDKKLVEESVMKADMKRFRFGGDEVLDSVKMMKIPAMVGGKKIMMKTHVVLSKIPLLWSRPGMKKAGLVLDLPKDRALIFGKWQELQTTSVGHYALYIVPMEDKPENCLLNMPVEKEEKKAVILKLHRQFGHPGREVLENLLKKAALWDKGFSEILTQIYGQCKTCRLFSQTPPRPVVSLPPASEFGEVLTLDLKEIKVKNFNYIFHMIDGFTRHTVSVFIPNKKPETIVNCLLTNWVGVGYGVPKKCWSDVGGEFCNNTMREVGEALGCVMDTGAGYSAWQNGINERNHSVVDRCYEKIVTDNPRMEPRTALAWAVNAKNSFPMFNGFSSFQLVFGKNPTMPNILTDKLPALNGVTTSQSLADHIQGIYAGRQAFTEALCSDRIRTALRHKVRAVEKEYRQGDKVYYRRDGGGHMWKGPATVLGRKGTVYFIVHQSQVYRVAGCRLVAVEEAAEQLGERLEQGAGTEQGATPVNVREQGAVQVKEQGAVEYREQVRAGHREQREQGHAGRENLPELQVEGPENPGEGVGLRAEEQQQLQVPGAEVDLEGQQDPEEQQQAPDGQHPAPEGQRQARHPGVERARSAVRPSQRP